MMTPRELIEKWRSEKPVPFYGSEQEVARYLADELEQALAEMCSESAKPCRRFKNICEVHAYREFSSQHSVERMGKFKEATSD